jgi:hypothetical protein
VSPRFPTPPEGAFVVVTYVELGYSIFRMVVAYRKWFMRGRRFDEIAAERSFFTLAGRSGLQVKFDGVVTS